MAAARLTDQPFPVHADEELVARLLGRRPLGRFEVVVRRDDGSPVVIENGPFLESGRPMPTRFWLADRALNRVIGRLEAEHGVKRAEAELAPEVIAELHQRHAAHRDALLPEDHQGPRPSGGVGGTRQGLKCLHAHYANYLAGDDDAVGRWVHDRLSEWNAAFDPTEPGISSDLP